MFADVTYADGGGERYLLLDEVDWAALLERLAIGPIEGRDGLLELRGELPADLAGERTPATDQSNTLVALGELLLIKAYRRLEAGAHPEIEMLAALRGSDAPVPAMLGSLHHVDRAGVDTAVALLEEFVPDMEDGWEAPIERVAAHLRGESEAPLEEWRVAGEAAARLHLAAAERLGARPATAADVAAPAERASAQLAEAATGDEDLAELLPLLPAGLRGLDRLTGTTMQRIHGDLHPAQLLRAADSVLIIDFEGDPTRPLAERGELGSPLYDLACLLRGIDHVGTAASRRAGGGPTADPGRWVAAAREHALGGYGPVDPELLRALEVCKECSEVLYAQRALPEWLYAPLAGLRSLLREEGS